MNKAKNIPTPVKGQGMQAQSVEQFEKNQEENEKRALLQGFQTLSQINASFGMAPTLNQPDGGGNDAATDARIKHQMVPQTKKTFEKFYEIKKSIEKQSSKE